MIFKASFVTSFHYPIIRSKDGVFKFCGQVKNKLKLNYIGIKKLQKSNTKYKLIV